VARREIADQAHLILIDSNGEEMAEPLILAEYPERAVLGSDKLAGGLHDPFEYRLEREVLGDRDDRAHEAVHMVLDADELFGALDEFAQQVLDPSGHLATHWNLHSPPFRRCAA
jgi:hypothetical protein